MRATLATGRTPWTRLRPAALVTLAVLAATWAIQAAGVAPAVDGALRRGFYELRGPRPAAATVLFVAIDETTVEAWGPPPWPWARYEELAGAALGGGARAVAVLEPGPRVLPGDPPPAALADAVGAGRLHLPPARAGFGQPLVALDAAGVVEAIELGDPGALGGPTITAALVASLGGPSAGRLPVNFAGGPDALPTLPAHHVARGEIPPATFRGRIVVVGLRGERFTAQVPTPVGPMAPAEVHAHAVHAVASGAAWRRAGAPVLIALTIACAIGGVVGLRRARSAAATAARLAAAAALLVAAGYLAFTRAAVVLDLGAPLWALALGAIGGLALERGEAHHEARELAAGVARHVRVIGAGRAPATDDALHDGFARAVRGHLGATSCVWGELPPGGWHLALSRWDGMREDDVVERRRDVRRDPWRLPYGSHRPEWSVRRFVADDAVRTLIVPLAAYGRILGAWMFNLPAAREVGDAQLRAVEAMADQLAVTLEQRRLERAGAARGRRRDDRLASAVLDTIDAARQDVLALGHVELHALSVLEHLPVGVVTATMWGHVEHCNAAMGQLLAAVGVADPRRLPLAELLARATGAAEPSVREVIRAVAEGGAPVRLDASAPAPVGPPAIYDLVLARVQFAPDLAHPDEHGPSTLVLTATRRPDAAAAPAWRWSDVEGRAIDVAHLVRETLVALARDAELEVRAAAPVVIADAELAAAIRTVLGEAVPGDEPARVIVEDDRGAVTIRVVVPGSSLPRADVEALRAAAPGAAPAHLADLVRARADLEAARGALEVDSDLDRGTELALRLPRSRGEG